MKTRRLVSPIGVLRGSFGFGCTPPPVGLSPLRGDGFGPPPRYAVSGPGRKVGAKRPSVAHILRTIRARLGKLGTTARSPGDRRGFDRPGGESGPRKVNPHPRSRP